MTIAKSIPPRERLLKAAEELFHRYGIRGVGVEAIAEAADTNKMTLYRHFPSKDELVAEWLRGIVAEKERMWSEIDAKHPDDPRAHRLLGVAFDKKELPTRARESYRRAAALNG